MKSFTTGVSVRFFSVIAPTGHGGIGRFTGRSLNCVGLATNRNSEAGNTPRYGPLGTSAQVSEVVPRTVPFGGNAAPQARNASAICEPIGVSGNGRHHGSSDSSDSLS